MKRLVLILLLSLILTACSEADKNSKSPGQHSESKSSAIERELIEKMKQGKVNYITRQGSSALVELNGKNGYMFELYNLDTGEIDKIQTQYHVTFEKMKITDDWKEITFFADGRNIHNAFNDFPFTIKAYKKENGFVTEKETRYLPLSEQAVFGSKGKEVIKDIIITMQGLQVAFGPIPGTEDRFFAAYIDIPRTRTAYDEEKHQLTLEFSETKVGGSCKNLGDKSFGNRLIKSIQLEEVQDKSNLIINLTDDAKLYTASIENVCNEIPYLDIKFKG